jgi:hypothetical protein
MHGIFLQPYTIDKYTFDYNFKRIIMRREGLQTHTVYYDGNIQDTFYKCRDEFIEKNKNDKSWSPFTFTQNCDKALDYFKVK